ncbi:hypothetical protein NY2A_b353R [Paramecium bursaria Chlorella virus NY2A]|uniref:Uncharacterized protein b353R n=1 Tax=Paramecium bursaria Chlorella virus NY2A TaxID=46021 RepID=A7IWM8_PBCVN|nr:hypothetical protein NY2A_b353R [Paramecium bursaria Chlorella virus NY2A]ABT14752.1 hypothetical protein NY2A_b353R [Paramecium bursaria Chlorella virus NY2A]
MIPFGSGDIFITFQSRIFVPSNKHNAKFFVPGSIPITVPDMIYTKSFFLNSYFAFDGIYHTLDNIISTFFEKERMP